jgi:hypothetical protein
VKRAWRAGGNANQIPSFCFRLNEHPAQEELRLPPLSERQEKEFRSSLHSGHRNFIDEEVPGVPEKDPRIRNGLEGVSVALKEGIV